MMRHRSQPWPATAGFGLVEIMVGLAIGMIATLVIVQVASTFEGQKRITTGGADAQTAGNIAIYSMQRQIQMAGYGLPIFSNQNQALNCTEPPTLNFDLDADPDTPDEPVNVSIMPLEVVDGADGGSDSVIVRKGNTVFGGMPLKYPPGTDELKTVSCRANDIVLITNGTDCRMTKVTAAATLQEPTTLLELEDNFAITGSFACLGDEWQQWDYRVQDGSLLERGTQIATGVVNMQARYGVSLAANTNQVTSYVDATDPDWGPTMSAASRNRIKAIRIALVVRNSKLEREDVTEACSSLTESNPTGLCAWAGTQDNPAPAIDLSADPNWQRYRYRVFDTIIPLRNMIWSADKL